MKKIFIILMIAITSLAFAKENTNVTKTYNINNIKEFSFEATNMPVKAIPTNGENIILIATSDRKLEFKESNKDGIIKVEAGVEVEALPFYKRIFKQTTALKNVSIVIEIPVKYNNQLNIKTKNSYINASDLNVNFQGVSKNGEITISNITGNVNLENTNGELVVDDIKGIVDLKTTNGEINLTNATSIRKLKSTNGEINAKGNELVKGGSIETTNGTINLKINYLRGDNKISSTNGDIKLVAYQDEFHINKFNKKELTDTAKNIVIKTTNGSLDIN